MEVAAHPSGESVTHRLAHEAADSQIALAVLGASAPPSAQEVILSALKTMSKLALHVYAMIEEGGACEERVVARVQEYRTEIERLKHEVLSDHEGEVMKALFAQAPAGKIDPSLN